VLVAQRRCHRAPGQWLKPKEVCALMEGNLLF
jgi:hypothetical protein